MRMLFLFIMLALLSGCSTARNPTALNNLQIKVAQLERKVTERDNEILALKDDIKLLGEEMDYLASDTSGAVTRYDEDAIALDPPVIRSNPSDEQFVRVPVSVQQVQLALKGAGYYQGSIDGKFGNNSQKAVRAFQKDNNMVVDGIIGKQTWGELKAFLD